VQPALDQLQKWDPARRDEVLSAYYHLSAPEGAPMEPRTVLVWPESAFPFALTQEPGVLAAIAELLPQDTALVTGAYRVERPPEGERKVFNSIYVIGDDGTITAAYDKVHLVPFGEYVPFPDHLDALGLRQLVPSGFSPGPTRETLELPFGPAFSPLICYEIAFSGAVLSGGERPSFLLNVTNDGWFGTTTGPYQHFHQARVRAVEEGLPLVRAANTGISAVADGYGRVLSRTALGDATMIEARLPAALPSTLYAEWRSVTLLLSLAASLVLACSGFLYPAYRL
jgi:apolipoprotein N-acyltransferase